MRGSDTRDKHQRSPTLELSRGQGRVSQDDFYTGGGQRKGGHAPRALVSWGVYAAVFFGVPGYPLETVHRGSIRN